MNNDCRNDRKLSTLDYVFTALSSDETSLDFALVFHFSKHPGFEALNLGAQSARNKFPTTSSIVHGSTWKHIAAPDYGIEYAAVSDLRTAGQLIERLLETPFDLRVQFPYRQLLIVNGSGAGVLATRFHHAVADGLSAALWLAHQLRVALNMEEPLTCPAIQCSPEFRISNTSVRRSKFAYAKASDSLWTSNQRRANQRRWISLAFDSRQLRTACRRTGGFTFSDLLATCALETFSIWNHSHNTSQQIGLWFPINVRRKFSCGFGNGTSRIRLYPRFSDSMSITGKAREVRRQIQWCTNEGEWVLPTLPFLGALPKSVLGSALSFYLKRSSVDMATGVFSHADSCAGDGRESFQTVDRVEAIGLLHPRQAVAINGTTLREETNLTLTYDSGLLSPVEANELAELYKQCVTAATEDLDARVN